MTDAWIFTDNETLAESVSNDLIELGYTPRRLPPTPPASGRGEGTNSLAPTLLCITVTVEGSAAMLELGHQLREQGHLSETPFLWILDVEALRQTGPLPPGDELLVSPWSRVELITRITRATTRLGVSADTKQLQIGSLILNQTTYQVTVEGVPLDLTYVEYTLLRFLMSYPNRVFPREVLLDRVWGYTYYGGIRTVDVHVQRLRAKLGSEHAQRLQTVRSVGYRFER